MNTETQESRAFLIRDSGHDEQGKVLTDLYINGQLIIPSLKFMESQHIIRSKIAPGDTYTEPGAKTVPAEVFCASYDQVKQWREERS